VLVSGEKALELGLQVIEKITVYDDVAEVISHIYIYIYIFDNFT
jgi:hypothetical protein